jgi:hypothetical protein
MKQRTPFAAAATLAVAALFTASAAADGAGPSPGQQLGWDGVRTAGAPVRYVALSAGWRTAVAAVRVRDGRVLRWTAVRGGYGIPVVSWDGTTDGLSQDGRVLVLASFTGRLVPGATTRFAVLRTKDLRVSRTIVLRGVWSFDAVSPDGRVVYAVQYVAETPTVRYRVRAIDVGTGRPRPRAIVDRREPGERMSGSPVTRASGSRTAWVYTLYAKTNGTAFIHALDTRRAQAICIELPWRRAGQSVWGVRMAVSADGRTLALRQPGVGVLATVDLRRYIVRALRPPRVER